MSLKPKGGKLFKLLFVYIVYTVYIYIIIKTYMKTALQILCEIHGQQGGTIHDFNSRYGLDFISSTPRLKSGAFNLGLSDGNSNKTMWKNNYIAFPSNSFDNPSEQTKIDFFFGFLSAYADNSTCPVRNRQSNYHCSSNPDNEMPCSKCGTWDMTL